jgi:DNA-binding transcriptional ArsR family regulator
MSINEQIPDYDLAERMVVTAPAQLRAMADPLRATILDLLLERAATVAELASAVTRPKSTIAHHVNVLVNAGLLRVIRTRRVRAIDERYYGRTARLFQVGVLERPGEDPTTVHASSLSVAAGEARRAHAADELRAILRHARVPEERAEELWQRILALVQEFSRLPRSGETVFGLAVALYPTDYPTLPDPEVDDG